MHCYVKLESVRAFCADARLQTWKACCKPLLIQGFVLGLRFLDLVCGVLICGFVVLSRRVLDLEVEPDGGGGRRDGGWEAACRSRITVIGGRVPRCRGDQLSTRTASLCRAQTSII